MRYIFFVYSIKQIKCEVIVKTLHRILATEDILPDLYASVTFTKF